MKAASESGGFRAAVDCLVVLSAVELLLRSRSGERGAEQREIVLARNALLGVVDAAAVRLAGDLLTKLLEIERQKFLAARVAYKRDIGKIS